MTEEMQVNYESYCERVLDVEEDPRPEFLPWQGYQNQQLVSLGAATQKVSGRIESLSHDLLIIKERIPKTPEDNLSTDESAAIYLYTLGPKPGSKSLSYISYLKLLITALLKLDSVGHVIYRGIKADLSEKYSVGKTFVWSKFSSCASFGQMLWSEYLLGENGARTFFKINCSNGKNIRRHSAFTAKDEIILLPGTKFKVISRVSPSNDLHIIEIQEVVASTLFHQRSPTISKEVNVFPVLETNPKQIDSSKTLSEKIEKQQNQSEGDFSLCDINDEQVSLIANVIKTNTTWKILKLNSNKINYAGIVRLTSALVLNSTIEMLFLDDNFVGDYGARLLADSLKDNHTLVSLTLAGNDIKEVGAKVLAELLCTNNALTDLSLDENVIGDNGMIALCKSLEQYNRTLTKLWVSNTSISDQSVPAIVTCRSMNYVLEDFIVDNNFFSKPAIDTLRIANEKREEILKKLSSIDEVVTLYLELKSIPEQCLTRDATFLFTNFRRILNTDALENYLKVRTNSTIYLILFCEDDRTIRLISSFCMKKQIVLYVLQTTNRNPNKDRNIFSCEESMMFRLANRIASHYRYLGDQTLRNKEKEKAQLYFQQGVDIQQKLADYLKKRRINVIRHQNGTYKAGQFPETRPSNSLISTVEN